MSVKKETVKYHVEDYAERIQAYKQQRDQKPKVACSNDDCNSVFRTSDNKLADIIDSMKKLQSSSKLLKFGVSFSGDYSTRSKLRMKCCFCPHKPMPYNTKNELRAKAERIVFAWRSKALSWLSSESHDISELNQSFKGSDREKNQSQSKFFNYNGEH